MRSSARASCSSLSSRSCSSSSSLSSSSSSSAPDERSESVGSVGSQIGGSWRFGPPVKAEVAVVEREGFEEEKDEAAVEVKEDDALGRRVSGAMVVRRVSQVSS